MHLSELANGSTQMRRKLWHLSQADLGSFLADTATAFKEGNTDGDGTKLGDVAVFTKYDLFFDAVYHPRERDAAALSGIYRCACGIEIVHTQGSDPFLPTHDHREANLPVAWSLRVIALHADESPGLQRLRVLSGQADRQS